MLGGRGERGLKALLLGKGRGITRFWRLCKGLRMGLARSLRKDFGEGSFLIYQGPERERKKESVVGFSGSDVGAVLWACMCKILLTESGRWSLVKVTRS